MRILSGQSSGPLVLLHGGAGLKDPQGDRLRAATSSLIAIGHKVRAALSAGATLADAVALGLEAMEADEQFNAGFGATLQADGQARLTAAVMDGSKQRFSGVMGATSIWHPSRLALALQGRSSRCLAQPGVELLARKLGLAVQDPISPRRLTQWYEDRQKCNPSSGFDTVGCLVSDGRGLLFAGSSTGGRGLESPGRVSDTATVAGTYASAHAAIAATGIGEEIVDDAVAARLETRCRDGLTMGEASSKTYAEALALGRRYGYIGVDCHGHWSVAHTTEAMSFVVIGEAGVLARADASSQPASSS